MKTVRLLTICAIALVIMSLVAGAQQSPSQCQDQGPAWKSLSFLPGGNINGPFLLTDGRVMVQYIGGGSGHPNQDWYALTPDHTDCYYTDTCGATWNELASLYNLWSPEYGPYGFASGVLADGKLIIQGGETSVGGQDNTNLGAIYDPSLGTLGTWSQLPPPSQRVYLHRGCAECSLGRRHIHGGFLW